MEQLHLQYPTYVKNTNSDAHIKVLKKATKSNGEIVEADIINLFSFIVKDNILNGEKIMFKTIQTTFLKCWSKHFASDLER